MNRREALIFVGGVLTGLAAGIPIGIVVLDKKLRKEYDESADAMRAAYEKALAEPIEAEAPVPSEEDLVRVVEEAPSEADTWTGETVVKHEPAKTDPYHTAVEVSTNENSFQIVGEPLSIEFIEEEEFDEDDGREKHTVVMLKAELGLPMIFIDGAHTEDWDIHLGDQIVSEYVRRSPTGDTPVWVRNHKEDADYVITMEMP